MLLPGSSFPTSGGTLGEELCPPGSPAGRLCQNGGFFNGRQAGLNISLPIVDGASVCSRSPAMYAILDDLGLWASDRIAGTRRENARCPGAPSGDW